MAVVCLSVCLSVCLTLSRERKGTATENWQEGSPWHGWPVTHLEVERSKVKVTRSKVKTAWVSKRGPHSCWRSQRRPTTGSATRRTDLQISVLSVRNEAVIHGANRPTHTPGQSPYAHTLWSRTTKFCRMTRGEGHVSRRRATSPPKGRNPNVFKKFWDLQHTPARYDKQQLKLCMATKLP